MNSFFFFFFNRRMLSVLSMIVVENVMEIRGT